LSLLTGLLAFSGIEIISVPCPSRNALQWLKQGRIHAAGSHLLDHATGEYNVPIIQRVFPKGSVRVVTFALWEQGLVTQRGNPKAIHSIADLHRPDVTIINREEGSGSRDLLDTGFRAAGIPKTSIQGYEQVAEGHLPAAYAVSAGRADCCIASQLAARRFGLSFIPLAVERFDLTFSRESLELPAAKALLEVLNQTNLRQKLRRMAGYETQQTGCVQL
jgi:molybdate-binding protein